MHDLKNKNLQSVMRDIFITLGVYFLIVSINCIVRPLYLPMLNKDSNVVVKATGEKNPIALANNIRISNLSINGKSMDLSAVELPENGFWKYDSENDFIYAYSVLKPTELVIQLKSVHFVEIELVAERGSGIVELQIDGYNPKTVDLYRDTDWDSYIVKQDISVWVFPENNIYIQISLFLALLVLICFGQRKKALRENVSTICLYLAKNGFLSVALMLMLMLIQYEQYSKISIQLANNYQSFLKATVFIFLAMNLFSIVTNSNGLGFLLTSVPLDLFCIASNIKILNRDVPLLPWDFTMIKEAGSVINNYEISISPRYITIIVITLLITLFLLFFSKKQSALKTSIIFRCSIAVVMIVAVLFFIESSFIDYDSNADYRVYQVKKYYDERGFVSAYLEYCSYLNGSNKPDTYSKENIERIVQEINEYTADTGDKTPTIIAVMSESFWNIDRMDTIHFYHEVCPNLDALKTESRYGELYTHVLNGGTVVSEFEFLTGFSGEFFPEDYMVYGNFLNDDFSSAIRILKNQGYKTTAIHPYAASNYNRENAYQKFGFDESYFEDSFENSKLVRNYISDQSLYEKVISTYEDNGNVVPQFIFAVTMQNHGGYWENTTYEAGKVPFFTNSYGEVACGSIDDYVSGLHESDRALGELVDYFRGVDEPVVIIYFGDHVSNAGPKDDRMLEKTSWHDDSMEYEYEIHKVPFVVWSNFDQQSENLGIMEIGELFPSVFDLYDIKANKFWNYIQDVRDVYGASSKRLVVDKEGSYSDLSTMTEEQKTDYDIYRLLQYDYIWGKRYAEELWDLN